MESYRLYTVVSELLGFLDKLTNWYIRLNRGRIKGDFGDEDCVNSLNVLFSTLLNLILLLSPFIPFITEEIYQNLKNGLDKNSPLLEESIHFLRIPEYNEKLLDNKIETVMNNMISVIELGRKLRENKKILLKKPVSKITVINYDKNFLDSLKVVENYIIDELNTNSIEYLSDEATYIELGIKPNFEILFKKCKEVKDTMITENRQKDPELLKEEAEYKKESNEISAAIKKLKEGEIRQLMKDGQLAKDNVVITSELVVIEKKFLKKYKDDKVNACLANSDCGIIINTETNEEIMNSYFCREIVNRIQKLRKESGIKIHDDIVIIYTLGDKCDRIKNVSTTMKEAIEKSIKTKYLDNENGLEGYHEHKSEKFEIGDEKENITIKILKK
jgi:isoleucyl-tRNA synthetase